MWCALRYGWYSIACAQDSDGKLDPDTVMIRARRKAHLQNLQKRFPEIASVEVLVTPRNDYRFRLILPKSQWSSSILAEMAMEQDYSNFKGETARWQGSAGTDYVRALHQVWEVMYRLQK
jgi:hypothetical protein